MVFIDQPDLSEAAMLAALGRRTFEQAFANQNTPENMEAYLSVAYTTVQLEKELNEENSVFYVARADETPVGYVRLLKNSQPDVSGNSIFGNAKTSFIAESCIEIQRIYVLQENVGLGVGARLMEQCLQTAQQHGFRTIWLGVWEHNAHAIAFYRRWGFETFGSHIFQLGDDPQTDLLMKRDV